jgi:hypothetical protein
MSVAEAARPVLEATVPRPAPARRFCAFAAITKSQTAQKK